MAIAVTDELQESVGSDSNQALRAVCGRSGFFLLIITRAKMPCRPLEWRLPCQMIFREAWAWTPNGL